MPKKNRPQKPPSLRGCHRGQGALQGVELREFVQPFRLHNDFDKHGIVLQVPMLRAGQLGQLDEHGAPAGDVHLWSRPLERRAGRVGAESVNDVLAVLLVNEHEGDLLLEGPGQEAVVVPPHQHEEERQVRVLAHPVPVGVNPCTHLVPHHPSVERRGVDARHLAADGVPALAVKVWNLPQQGAIIAGKLHGPHVHLKLRDGRILHGQGSLQRSHLRSQLLHLRDQLLCAQAVSVSTSLHLFQGAQELFNLPV